ncbi:MAG: class I SAM-dependent methyltransferase [Chlorobiaceae bacterium]|nr:class I SAM-dependent methyltransferase [Chlorobiaceae bacterium]
MMTNKRAYLLTRYKYTPMRRIVWQEISKYLFNKYKIPNGRVIEYGCGYGDWLGNTVATEKNAIENNIDLVKYVESEYKIDIKYGNIMSILPEISENSFDLVLASNFFEHFQSDDVSSLLSETFRVMRPEGLLVIIQPNYQYCFRNYFDDCTHRSIHTHTSISDLLAMHGFEVKFIEPRFLPFSFRSRLPINRYLVRSYLYSPIKPMGAQFLIGARPVK